MNEITGEQRAAVAWLHVMTQGLFSEAHHARALLAALPEALTNPQPVLPTEPGYYLDAHNDMVELFQDEWYFNGTRRSLDEVVGYAPLTRLVPERPEVTRDQIMGLLNELSAYSAGYKADKILDLVNGNRA